MRHWIVGVSATAMFSMATVAAAPRDTQETGRNEQAVTIRGCVMAGTEPRTFMLMRVTEVRPGQVQEQPVPTDAQGRDVLYWLSSTKGLKAEIGRRVEVKGALDPNDPKRGETKVSEDSSKRLDSTNKLSARGKSVKVKTDSQPEVDPTTTSDTRVKTSDKETERVVYRVKVTSVRSVEGTCP
jgi:hypothetical protein